MLVMTGGPAAAWSAIPAGHPGPACDVLCRPSAQSYAKKTVRWWAGASSRGAGRGMAWLRGGRLRWVIAGVALVALVAGAVVAWPYVQLYTGAAPPAQFYQKVHVAPALAQDYQRVLRVAHNAGNNLETLATAERYGAGVIEIDVISARGQLVAGRDQPWPWLARQLFRGPTLAEAWDRATAADIVKLDLKQTDRGFLDDLVAFLARRARSRRAMISSGD